MSFAGATFRCRILDPKIPVIMKSLNEFEMMTDETCIEEIASPPGKRRRVEKRECSKHGLLSIESMLSVPIDLIFRQLHEKPLLTRAEGQCFLKINFLAQEMEAIVQLAEFHCGS